MARKSWDIETLPRRPQAQIDVALRTPYVYRPLDDANVRFEEESRWHRFEDWPSFWSPCVYISTYRFVKDMPGYNLFGTMVDANYVPIGILDLLHSYSGTQCSDDRDRLFALLGASSDIITREPIRTPPYHNAGRLFYKPDYGATIEQAYRDFAQVVLRSSSAFQLLSYAWAFRQADKESSKALPSWVPDWRCETPCELCPGYKHCGAGVLRTRNLERLDETPPIVVNKDNYSIILKAVSFGTVKVVSEYGIHRRGIGTNNGFTAQATRGVTVGDEIVIPIGAPVPYVLRRQNPESDLSACYKLIGGCKVFDEPDEPKVMNGDYINQVDLASVRYYRIV